MRVIFDNNVIKFSNFVKNIKFNREFGINRFYTSSPLLFQLSS